MPYNSYKCNVKLFYMWYSEQIHAKIKSLLPSLRFCYRRSLIKSAQHEKNSEVQLLKDYEIN